MGKSESFGVARGVVQNIDQTVQSIQTAVAEAEAKSGVDIKVVNVGIAGQHIKSLQHRGIHTRNQTEAEFSQKDIDALIEQARLQRPDLMASEAQLKASIEDLIGTPVDTSIEKVPVETQVEKLIEEVSFEKQVETSIETPIEKVQVESSIETSIEVPVKVTVESQVETSIETPVEILIKEVVVEKPIEKLI